MKKKLTQVQVLAKELTKRSLTKRDIRKLGIDNAGDCVMKIRDKIDCSRLNAWGWEVIQTDMVKVKTRSGYSRIAVYSINKAYRREFKKFVKEFCK